jgi:hypothetical protein
MEIAPKPPPLKGTASSRDAPNLRANNPHFKERAPELRAADRLFGLSPERPASVALHGASLASDRPVRARDGFLFRLRARTGFPLTPSFGSLRAGPHERCRSSTNQSAFRCPFEPDESNPNERLLQPTRRSSTPGSDTSPRPPARWRRRRPSKAAGCRAPVTRLGVELPLCGPPGSDQASARSARGLLEPEAGTHVGRRSSPKNPERFRLAPCPEARPSTYRANGKAVETNPSTFAPSETTARHRGPSPAPSEPDEGVLFSRVRR